MPVRVITDSTAYLPDGLAQRRRIRQVPLHVVLVDGGSRLDGGQFGLSDLVAALGRAGRRQYLSPDAGGVRGGIH